MAEMTLFDLRVTVDRIEGRSVCGLRPGDYFEVTESNRLRIPEGRHFCMYALSSVLPLLPAKQRKLPDEDWLETETFVACPDAEERVIMRIERIGVRSLRAEDLTKAVGRLSIAFQTDKSPAEYVELARIAERAGFDTVSVYHDLFFQPAIHPLLLMARETECVRLGPAALNPYTLHPVEIAGQIAALDAASGGRAYLGLVRGTWLGELGIETERPLSRIREAVEVIRRLLAGDRGGFEGEHFALARGAGLRYEPLRREVPLLIGTWGPRLAAYAGAVAVELKVGGTANPDLLPTIRQRIGNDRVGIVAGAVCVVDEDGHAARRRARAEAALYFSTVAGLDPTIDVPETMLRDVERLVRAGDPSAAGALIPDDVLDRLAFWGTPAQVVRQVEALFDAGAARVELGTPHGLTDRGGVELLAARVAPAFRV